MTLPHRAITAPTTRRVRRRAPAPPARHRPVSSPEERRPATGVVGEAVLGDGAPCVGDPELREAPSAQCDAIEAFLDEKVAAEPGRRLIVYR